MQHARCCISDIAVVAIADAFVGVVVVVVDVIIANNY